MKTKTFRGGVHPLSNMDYGKGLTSKSCTVMLPVPGTIVIPMSRIIGAPAKPLVKKGDRVLMGQLIGEAQGFISANIHASVSGNVIAVEDRPHATGIQKLAVVIENDGRDEIHPDIAPFGTVDSLEPARITEIAKAVGLVGMGGATFPSHVKMTVSDQKPVDVVILNGAECEPYLTADERLMLENPGEVVGGLRLIMKAMGVRRGIIGIEDNKPGCIESMQKAIEPGEPIEVARLASKYPQGGEKQLIRALLHREVPSGGLPADAGVAVFNVGTAASFYNSVKTGMPSIDRIVTVAGSCIREPKNLRVRYGTSFADCIAFCGGLTEEAAKIISGGPMMGIAQPDDKATVIAGTSGILALSHKEAGLQQIQNCIRCARCVEACPVNLMPLSIAAAANSGRFEETAKLNANDCIECGACSFICPSRRPLVQSIRLAKNALRQSARK